MHRKYKLTLEDRIDRLEKQLTRKDEIAPVLANAGKFVIKNLPLLMKALGTIKTSLDNGINDNSELVDKFNKFIELGEELAEVLKNIK